MTRAHAPRSVWPLTVIATLAAGLAVQACSGRVQESLDCRSDSRCGEGGGASGAQGEAGSAAVAGSAGNSGAGNSGAGGVSPGACQNLTRDSDEADVDCGGTSKCDRCVTSARCTANRDCESNFCKANRCADPTCTDNVKNQDETATDCGGSCKPCDLGVACATNADCDGQYCKDGVCADHCVSGVRDSDETDKDCGGATCEACADSRRCVVAADCQSFICSAAGKCSADIVIAAADVIDDFEDGDLVLPASPAAGGRVGTWYGYGDGTGSASVGVSAIERGASSANALHMTGKGFNSWGSGIGVDLNNPGSGQASKVVYDAAAYAGITFWARAQSATTVTVTLPDVDTDMAGNTCSMCAHHYYKAVQVSTDWQRFTVAFSELVLEPGTVPAPTAFKPSGLFSVQFGLPAGQSYDLYFDDLAFVKK